MNPTDEEKALLASLDWEVVIDCAHEKCAEKAAILMQVNPGPDSCLHTNWAPVCAGHKLAMEAGHQRCPRCKETYIVSATRTL